MQSKLETLLEEYEGITFDIINVNINGKCYIDTAAQCRKDELEDEILEETIKIMKKQIKIARAYNVLHPYSSCNPFVTTTGVSYDFNRIYEDSISICFEDTHCDGMSDKYYETIKLDTLINFDENEYTKACIDQALKQKGVELIKLTEGIASIQRDIDRLLRHKEETELYLSYHG